MGLKTDIENAFVKTLGIDVDDKGNYPELAQNLTDAIVKFIQAQKFTITDMTAVLEVESITTTGDLSADIKNNVTYKETKWPGGSPTPTSKLSLDNIKEGVKIPKLNLQKSKGQGNSMTAIGHAYIGPNGVSSERNDTPEDTVVQLVDINNESLK